MLQILAATLAGFGLFLLLRSLWIRTGLSPRQVAVTLLAAAFIAALIALAATGRLNWVVPAAAALVPLLNRLAILLKVRALLHQLFPRWPGSARRARSGPADEVSTTETPHLRMKLHHRTGRMEGEILSGPQRGRFLSELSLADLTALFAAFDDADSERLLTAYLDRVFPEWRSAQQDERTHSAEIGRAEALEILGLAEGATEEEIVAAHRRLIQRLHPDRGGSTYLAARINAARRVLLP